ncbi:hypothetical protein [Bacillus sp. Marseille-Q3570]|nr:hypothetical protein [Bacillus sp. Marseille-Q3570]
MEKRHAANRNDHIYTIIQLVFLSILTLPLIATNFFGWL